MLESVVASGAGAAAGLVSGVFLARGLGPEARGQVAAVVAWVGALGTLSDMGLGFAVCYLAGRDASIAGRLLGQALAGAGLFGSLAWLIGGLALSAKVGGAGVPEAAVWAVFGIVPVILVANHTSNLLLGMGLARSTNAIRLTASVSYAAGVLTLFAAAERRAVAYLAAFCLAQVAGATAALVLALWVHRIRPRLVEEGLGAVVGFGLRAQASSISAQASLRLDQLLMSLFMPREDLGLYVVAVALASIPGPLYSGLSVGLTPRITQARTPREAVGQGLGVALLALAAGTAGALVLAAVAPWLLALLFGEAFAAARGAAWILLAASVFQGLIQIGGTILRSMGRPGTEAAAEVLGLAVTGSLLMLLLPGAGIRGAAWASLAAYATVHCLQLILLVRASGVGPRQVAADAFLRCGQLIRPARGAP
ncbi:MAG: polysaccharide biosynthesis C-terminal domain-containing protein [Anaeromyxobacter sp.]|nr:polysaccharide biosynthesis C-terminal domain-containing protein [Anaeromyxobacter sp.]